MGKQSVDNTSIMKVLFAINLVLLPMLAMGQEEERLINTTNISEKQSCYVPGQCQEYSVNFKRTDDVDLCHKFCGQNEDCSWWSFEPSQKLCLSRECHGAFKCQDIFIDSFEIEHLEDCLEACSDVAECMYFTLEKTHNHCILYEGCEAQLECETCATGERECSAGYHGPTESPAPIETTAPPTTPAPCPYGNACVTDDDCCADYDPEPLTCIEGFCEIQYI